MNKFWKWYFNFWGVFGVVVSVVVAILAITRLCYPDEPSWQSDPGDTQRIGDTTFGSNMAGKSYTIQHGEQSDTYNDLQGHTANVIHGPNGHDVYQSVGTD